MRAFAAVVIMVVASPMTVLAQSSALIPQPMIPQTHVPGAGPASGYTGYGPGVGVGVVAPIQGGGAVVVAPGYPPGYVVTPAHPLGAGAVGPGGATYVVPGAGGGTTILSPNYGTTIIRPNPAGGTTIIGPNQPTTLIMPTEQGGSVILGPGGTGYVVPTPHGSYIQPPGSAPPAVIYHR
jgi:hypothetical protein